MLQTPIHTPPRRANIGEITISQQWSPFQKIWRPDPCDSELKGAVCLNLRPICLEHLLLWIYNLLFTIPHILGTI